MAIEKAGENAGDVAIDDGSGAVEGETTHGSGGVATNSRKGFESFGVERKFSIEIPKHGLGGFLKISDAIVITESLPGSEDLSFRSGGNGFYIREFLEEFFETTICDDRGDRGLLKHDLGDENGPGIGRLSPGIGLGIGLKPLEESVSKGSLVINRMTICAGFLHGLV